MVRLQSLARQWPVDNHVLTDAYTSREEENYKRLMDKKIKGARSTVSGYLKGEAAVWQCTKMFQ